MSELGAGGVAVVSPVAGTVASDPAAPSLLAGPSAAVDVSDDVEHVPDVVVGVAVSAPSVVLPGATPSAAGVQEVSVAAIDVSVTAAVLSAVVVVSDDVAHVPDVVVAVVSAPSVVLPDGGTASAAAVQEVSVTAVDASATASVLSAVVVVSVEDDDESVDEIELALSVVTSEGVSDAPAVVSDVCALPVTSAVVVVLASAEEAVAEGIAISSVAPGGTGTSSALADAIQVDVEATPTIKTAVQKISRSSRRRRQNVRSYAATLRVPSFIGSLLAPTASRQVASIAVTRRETKAATRFPERNVPLAVLAQAG